MKRVFYLFGFFCFFSLLLISCENKELNQLRNDYSNLKWKYDNLEANYKLITEHVADELILKDYGNDINEIEKRIDGYVEKYGSQFRNVYANKYNAINNNKLLYKKLYQAGKI